MRADIAIDFIKNFSNSAAQTNTSRGGNEMRVARLACPLSKSRQSLAG
jgi:hypothetical protein